MSLQELQRGTNFIETLDNYSLAECVISLTDEIEPGNIAFTSDQQFWTSIIKNPTFYYNKKISLIEFVISDWIARVPGLFWMPNSKTYRENAQAHISIATDTYTEFHPPGKSQMVMGGIGTLLLPPRDDGKILMSASSSCNASLGIPLLISEEVQDYLQPGTKVRIVAAKWQAMEESWCKKFVSGDEVPRGYLVIDSLEKIQIISTDIPIIYQPFSIMEYEHQDGFFYDYVYMTSDTRSQKETDIIKKFFNDYANRNDRYGEYLIASNMVTPLFEARYLSPSDLNMEAEKANLELLYRRIRGTHFSKVSLDELIIQLPKYYDSVTSLRTLAKKIGINPALIADGSPVNFSSQLINICIKRQITEILIDRLIIEYPKIFK